MTSKLAREENVQAVFDLKAGYTLGLADVEILKRVARMALAAMDSEPVVQPVMFIDGDISSDDADKLAKIIREFNEEDERPLAKMARIIRENPHPTNECDMPKAQPAPVVPEGLNPETADLVLRFASALADKLYKAEQKYGRSTDWMKDDWYDDCLQSLWEHIEKGDPRDVAAYCAFMWYHGWVTTDYDRNVQNACRAAMLQELQKSAGASNNCRSNEKVQAGEVQSVPGIKPAPALGSLPKIGEVLPTNSPVIPEGWTGNDKANAALMMLDRIETIDSVDDDRIDGIKRIVRELAAAPTGIPMIPDGYVMVPKEPTKAMILSAMRDNETGEVAEIYDLMLAAAPHDTPALNSLQSVDSVAGKWIPVSERMPEKGQAVLVYRPKAHEGGDSDVRVAVYGRHNFEHGFGCYWEPSHWMPLPAAPQEVGDA